MTAFNFANEDEAKVLRNILIEKIELRKQRREGMYIYLVTRVILEATKCKHNT